MGVPGLASRRPYAKKSVEKWLNHLRPYMRRLMENGLAPVDAKLDEALKLGKGKAPAQNPYQPLTPEEYERFSRAILEFQPKERAVLVVCRLGLRPGLVNKLKVEHVDEALRCLHAPQHKRGKCARIPLTPMELNILRTYIREARLRRGDVLFRDYHRKRVRKLVDECREKAKIRRRVTPQDLRKTAAEIYYQQTRDLPTVQRYLGHADIESTILYVDGVFSDADERVRPRQDPLAARPLPSTYQRPADAPRRCGTDASAADRDKQDRPVAVPLAS